MHVIITFVRSAQRSLCIKIVVSFDLFRLVSKVKRSKQRSKTVRTKQTLTMYHYTVETIYKYIKKKNKTKR